jgi:hypothetical protein
MFGMNKSKPAADRLAAERALGRAIGEARRAGVDLVSLFEGELASIRRLEHHASERRRMGAPNTEAVNEAWFLKEKARLAKEAARS